MIFSEIVNEIDDIEMSEVIIEIEDIRIKREESAVEVRIDRRIIIENAKEMIIDIAKIIVTDKRVNFI